MSLEGKHSRFASDQVINKALYPDDTVTLTANDQTVRAKTTSGNGAFTITLPNVVEAKGRFYSIYMVSRNSSYDITIADRLDETGLSDITLNAADERTLLYSDGYHWYTVASENI